MKKNILDILLIQIRTADPSEMVISWNSRSGIDSLVRWGVSPTNMTTIPATQKTYTVDQLCGPPGNGQGWRNPGFMHEAKITGIPGNVGVIYYQFGGIILLLV
jgi:hypothetical protein